MEQNCKAVYGSYYEKAFLFWKYEFKVSFRQIMYLKE